MAAKKDPLGQTLISRLEPSKRIHRVAQPIAVLRGLPERRRAVRALLSVGEVAAKHRESGVNEYAGHCHKQRRLAVRSRAVREHQRVTRGRGGTVQETAHLRRGSICKWSYVNVGKQGGSPLGR
jgi:hypothetical protein